MNIPDRFGREYDLDSLVRVSPRGQNFSFMVTPRYRDRYHEAEYEAFTARYLRAILARTAIFVDVGAHYGFYSLLGASSNEDLHIIAVEPVAETRDVLIRNIESFCAARRRLPRFTVCENALSDGSGARPFHIAVASDSCSFYCHPKAAPIRQVVVNTTSLDALLSECAPAPLVVKIDTEGHELAVLRGMRETLRRFENVSLVVELAPELQGAAGVQPEELVAELVSSGFAVFIADDVRGLTFRVSPGDDWRRFMNSDGYANLICVRKSRALSICFLGHRADANGAERTLQCLVEDLVGQHGALCSVVLPQPGHAAALARDAGAGSVVAPYSWWCHLPHEGAGAEAVSEELYASLVGCATGLLPLIRDIDPDVICTQTITIPWGSVVAVALKKPHIWSICEYGELDHGLRFVPSFNEVAADVARGADFFFFCSRDVQATLFPDLAECSWDVLYRHIDMRASWEEADSAMSSPHRFRLAIFGTISESKGQRDAIAAAALLKSRGRAIELSVVGKGQPDYVAELRRHIGELGLGDEVHFVDFLMNPYPAMSRADVVLVCSRREAFGRTAVEAMLLGKPVVYAAAGGVAEYMRDGETGLAYPPGDADALADRIETLLRAGEVGAKLGANGQAYARATFNRDQFSGKFYRKAIEMRGAQSTTQMPTTLWPAIERTFCALDTLKDEKAAVERAVVEAQDHASGLREALDSAQRTIAALEKSLGEAESRTGGLSASLAEAEGRAGSLSTSLAAAKHREEHLRASLVTRSAQLAEAQGRIEGLDIALAAAERRAGEYGASLDRRTAELAQARSETGAMQQLLSERDRELGELGQRIAAMEGSLSWRLTSPVRDAFRAVRDVHFRAKLAAALRHPTNARKRRDYRSKRLREIPAAGSAKRITPLGVKLRALARHPLSSRLRAAYRAQERGRQVEPKGR